ncbi:hypothetical protein Tco_0662100 [Tanacetum coccineum]
MKSLATWWKDDGIIRQCLCTVANGHLTVAVKVLSSSGVAPYCDDTIKALEAKHPYKPPSSISSSTFSKPPIVSDIDSVFSCIKSFPKGTSCRRNGLRAHHILDALCEEWKVSSYFGRVRCFCSTDPIMPLLKSDNESRPIVFELGVSSGAEALLHNVNRVLSEYHNDGSLVMLNVDFLNAFNLVDRSALLHEVRVRSIEIIVVFEGSFFGDLQWQLASLPIRFGGLGLYSSKVVFFYAFVASMA